MKSIVFFILLTIIPFLEVKPLAGLARVHKVEPSGIKNGWYEATVKYTNFSTYTNETYLLKVYVEYNSVSTIDFGNGGSVHSGYNNEGYTYSSGYLREQKDYEGNIISVQTTVSVFDKNGTRTFDILIQ